MRKYASFIGHAHKNGHFAIMPQIAAWGTLHFYKPLQQSERGQGEQCHAYKYHPSPSPGMMEPAELARR